MSMAPFNFGSLSKRQIEALCDVAFGGNGWGFSDRTMKSLERHGLIEPQKVTLAEPGQIPMRVTVWEMPIGAHIDFCAWCSEQPEDENE